jgi:hypothetical protein
MSYPYETLDYAGRLQFKDAFGLEAYFHCYQRLRVLAPEVFAVTQHAWGLGDPVHDFVAPAAAAVQVVTDGNKLALVMVLKEPARRGDEIKIHSIRRIHHAFKQPYGAWELMPFTPTGKARVSIDFPVAREPEGISVSSSTGSPSPYVRRTGTKELQLMVSNPVPGALYRADWSW